LRSSEFGEADSTLGEILPSSEMTRRRLLQVGTAAALLAATARLPDLERLPLLAAPAAAHLRRSAYTSLSDRSFRVRSGPASGSRLQLTAVEDLHASGEGGRSLAGRDDAFALVFRGPTRPKLPQGIYPLSNRELGRAELFLIPDPTRGRRGRYRAIVNRTVGA
jgi:hypothetical protein